MISVYRMSRKELLTIPESRTEGFNMFLGVLCDKGHKTCRHDGVILNASIRYYKNHTCIQCALTSSRRQNYEHLKTDQRSIETRRKLEDVLVARDLGMSLQDYLDAVN